MAWSLLFAVAPWSTAAEARPGGRRRRRGRAHRRGGAGAQRPGRSGHRCRRQDGLARLHRHALALRPLLLRLPVGRVKIRQGVTTEVVGMCSFSQAPLRPTSGISCEAGPASRQPGPDWETFAQYLDALRSRPAVGEHRALRRTGAAHRGHGLRGAPGRQRRHEGDAAPARRGHGRRRVRPLDRARLRAERLLRHGRADRAGEVDVVARRLLLLHIRGESSMLLDSINEAIRIGEEGGVAVQVSHVRASGKRTGRRSTALRLFETARARGVTCWATSIPTTPAAPSSTT